VLPPDDGSTTGVQHRQTLSTNDKLRKQLLGKRARDDNGRRSGHATKNGVGPKSDMKVAKPRLSNLVQDDSDAEEGRSSLGRHRRRVKRMEGSTVKPAMDALAEGQGRKATLQMATKEAERAMGKKQRPATYLDELLAERSKKKKKKNGEQILDVPK